MKFGKRLLEEMIEEWSAHYISYKRLKGLVTRSPLTGAAFREELLRAIRDELDKAETFFSQLFDQLMAEYESILVDDKILPNTSLTDANKMRSNSSIARVSRKRARKLSESTKLTDELGREAGDSFNDSTVEMSEPNTPHHSFAGRVETKSLSPQGFLQRLQGLFLGIIGDSRKRKISPERLKYVEWFASAVRLEHFAQLNLEAVRKTLKKATKNRPDEQDLTEDIESIIDASTMTGALTKLASLIEQVQSQFLSKFQEPLGQYNDLTVVRKELWHAKWHFVALSFALFCLSMFSPVFATHPPAHRCFALFMLVICMWVSEAIPFFCTAMLIPLVAVPLGILQDPATGGIADPTVSARVMLGRIFDHVQILVLGGLTIAKAMSRTKLEVVVANALHRWTAHRPELYMLGIMLFGCVLCSFVSNVAAPLLVLSVIQTTLWEFPPDSSRASSPVAG